MPARISSSMKKTRSSTVQANCKLCVGWSLNRRIVPDHSHGWLSTGDEGFFHYDEQGRKFFLVTGRLREIILRDGVNISPLEIDEVLMHMPGIQAGIAVGFENDWYGEEVGAYVQPRYESELNEEDVLSYCRKHLPFSKSPKVVVFDRNIPATSTDGYQRNKCKDLFLNWKSVQFGERTTYRFAKSRMTHGVLKNLESD